MGVVVGMDDAMPGKEETTGISLRSKRSGVKMGSRERALGDIGRRLSSRADVLSPRDVDRRFEVAEGFVALMRIDVGVSLGLI
jgi:hypothetical protein